jgi:hypothetical protein
LAGWLIISRYDYSSQVHAFDAIWLGGLMLSGFTVVITGGRVTKKVLSCEDDVTEEPVFVERMVMYSMYQIRAI